ncbi:hypothetical protein LRP49_11875 [Enterovibrio sp. ZSDZ35]|uniref:LafD n=1 Tax=Enterovibrio qingdaonensis TaxID=2899818 RepID=A0ABT5QLN1_9GAMM|nr:hypothetical protein [Enterovibrio sp. ZSDZ35]MDD1781873.1 hypothetical protein [Enterovibrio sp. ZSDZ35]
MVNTHNATSQHIQRLSKQIHHVALAQDWQALKQLDLKVRELLTQYPDCLSTPALSHDLAQLKRVHKNAVSQLAISVNKMETELAGMQAQQERAKAYQMAMTMEYPW